MTHEETQAALLHMLGLHDYKSKYYTRVVLELTYNQLPTLHTTQLLLDHSAGDHKEFHSEYTIVAIRHDKLPELSAEQKLQAQIDKAFAKLKADTAQEFASAKRYWKGLR